MSQLVSRDARVENKAKHSAGAEASENGGVRESWCDDRLVDDRCDD
jgi:hypothetical protein